MKKGSLLLSTAAALTLNFAGLGTPARADGPRGASLTSAQEALDSPIFEVATMKPHDMRQFAQPAQINPSYIRLVGASLTSLLMNAYGLKIFQINGPGWMKETYFDIVAKLPPGASRDQIPSMLQALLAERLHLKTHWEYPEERAYVLVLGKSSSKLKKSAEGEEKRIHLNLIRGRVEARAVTFDEFADVLTSCCSDRPIIDQTAAPGRFDLVLDIGTDSMNSSFGLRSGGSGAAEITNGATDASGPSVLDAVRSLGLELKKAKLPTKHLCVDAVDKTPISDD